MKQWSTNKKALVAVIVLALVASTIFLILYLRPKQAESATSQQPAQTTSNTEPQKETAKPTTIRFVATGDMLAHDSVNAQAKTATGYSYLPFFSEVTPFYNRADIRFCNQEGLSSGANYGISGYPSFNAPEQFAYDLNSAGCNLINLANNHINDKGQNALAATVDIWRTIPAKFAFSGANAVPSDQSVKYFEVKGVKFAFLAYAEYSNNRNVTANGLTLYSPQLATQQLAEARKNAQVVIVSMHWGTEYVDSANSFQTSTAKVLADNGADIVIGTGPHVLQPVAKLPKAGGGETLVWYSLGNMLSTQLEIASLIGGFAVMDFNLTSGKPVLSNIGFMPTYMHYEWTPAQKAADDLLARKNLRIYPLDQASAPLSKSLNNTSVEAQTARVKEILNRNTAVTMLTSQTY